jgi:hypothetical protein
VIATIGASASGSAIWNVTVVVVGGVPASVATSVCGPRDCGGLPHVAKQT